MKKWFRIASSVLVLLIIASMLGLSFRVSVRTSGGAVSIGVRWGTPVYAAAGDTKQFIISGTSSAPTAISDMYNGLMGNGNMAWNANENRVEGVIPTAGKLSNFKVGVAVAPGAGQSRTFTVRWAVSAGTMADTVLSVNITGTDVLSPLDTDIVVVAAGDKVAIKAIGTGTPTAAGAVYWTVQFTPDTDGETILLSNTGGDSINANSFHALVGGRINTTTEFNAQTIFPTAGTLKNFYVELRTAPGAGNSRTFTIVKNSVNTTMVVTISETAKTGNDTDPSHNIAIAAGDKVAIYNTLTGTLVTTWGKYGIVFLPDTQGEWFTSATTDDSTSSTAVEYQQLTAGDTTLTANESKQHNLAQAATAKKIYVNLSTAPGAGNSWIFTLREALADTALTVTISGTNTSGNAAVDEVIVADALVNSSIDATAGSATSRSQIAILFYNAPEAGGEPAITVSPTTYDFGAIVEGSTTNTTTTYFTINNTSTMQTDQTISVTTANWTGGVGWTHSDTATAGENQVGMKANKGGTWGTGDVIVKYNAVWNDIATNQAANTDYQFGLSLIAPTEFTDGVQKQIVIRITAAAG